MLFLLIMYQYVSISAGDLLRVYVFLEQHMCLSNSFVETLNSSRFQEMVSRYHLIRSFHRCNLFGDMPTKVFFKMPWQHEKDGGDEVEHERRLCKLRCIWQNSMDSAISTNWVVSSSSFLQEVASISFPSTDQWLLSEELSLVVSERCYEMKSDGI